MRALQIGDWIQRAGELKAITGPIIDIPECQFLKWKNRRSTGVCDLQLSVGHVSDALRRIFLERPPRNECIKVFVPSGEDWRNYAPLIVAVGSAPEQTRRLRRVR